MLLLRRMEIIKMNRQIKYKPNKKDVNKIFKKTQRLIKYQTKIILNKKLQKLKKIEQY